MKMTATWFRTERGFAIGVIVGALTVGKATPYLVRAIPHVGLRPVILASSVGALLAAVLVAASYRDGPYPFAPRQFSWNQVRDVVRVREWQLATASYLGHMFELYAFWTWIPAFLAASVAASQRFRAPRLISLLAFTTIAIGGAGSVWGGLFADKRGRERLVSISLFMSGSCCLISGLLFGGPIWVLGALAIAVVIGTALNTLVKAVVDDFIMPLILYALPGGDWQNATWTLGRIKFGVGDFLAAAINFIIVAFVAWRISKIFIKPPGATKNCPFC